MSLARRHRERKLAARANEQAGTGDVRHGAAATEYQLMLIKLGDDLRQLKNIQSIERKIERKRALLPSYDAWIAGALAADSPAQDEILAHVTLWRIDTGDFAAALPLAAHMLKHKIALPERFNRTLGCVIAEEIATAALAALAGGSEFDPRVLAETEALTRDEDMPDEARAKLHKAIGLLMVRTGEQIDPAADGPAGMRKAVLTGALDQLRRARALDAGCGVKKEIDRVERLVKRLDAEADKETDDA